MMKDIESDTDSLCFESNILENSYWSLYIFPFLYDWNYMMIKLYIKQMNKSLMKYR